MDSKWRLSTQPDRRTNGEAVVDVSGKDQTSSAMNINKNATSTPDTIPTGPLTSIGRLHTARGLDFPLLSKAKR